MSNDYKPILRPGSDPLVFLKYPGSGEGAAYSRGHLMAAAIARELQDGELVFMGENFGAARETNRPPFCPCDCP